MLGARNRRRLLIAVGALVVIGAAVAGGSMLGHSPKKTVDPYADNGPSLVFGMTKQQVEHITGPPTKQQGSCLYFLPKHGKIGAIPMANTFPAGPHEGYLRLCFVEGQYSSAARQVLASSIVAAPFPGGKRATNATSGWTWQEWIQNPERGACSRRPAGCVAH
jgi:hypothetical protein